MKRRGTIVILLLGLILITATACGSDDKETTNQQPAEDDINVTITADGNIEASREAKLTFGSGGKIDKIFVDEGDEVTKGRILARLDIAPLELGLIQAQATLAQAQATLAQAQVTQLQAQIAQAPAQVTLSQAQAALTQAQAALQTAEYNLKEAQEPYTEQDISNAQAALDEAEYYLWYAEMKEENAWEEPIWAVEQKRYWEHEVYRARLNLGIAQQNLDTILSGTDEDEIAILEMQMEAADIQLETAELEFEVAGTQLTVVEPHIEAANLHIEAANLHVEAAEQALEEAQKQLDRATITAPFDGVVVSVDVDEGDTVSTATPIVHLIDLSHMELVARVDELDIAKVETGQKVMISVDAIPEAKLEGRVTFISPVAREPVGVILFEDDDEVKSYEVKIDFDILEDLPIRAGMSATAEIIVE